jgi:hypothetical protein
MGGATMLIPKPSGISGLYRLFILGEYSNNIFIVFEANISTD